MTAPAILRELCESRSRVAYGSRAPLREVKVERVEVDIEGDVEKMRIALDKYLLVLALPERTDASIPLVKIFCIAHIKLLHKERYTVLDEF